jgi:bacterioferritin (cytochrome b1)
MTMWNPNPEPATRITGETVGMDPAIRQLNSLLRGEISATETYRMAIEAVGQKGEADQVQVLRTLQEEHGRAAQSLRDRIRELGGEASDSSGAWGAWAKLTQATANLFGDAAALKSLKEGEEHGLKDYEEARSDVDATSATLIENQLMPQQQRHISLLDRLIHAASA